MNLFHNDCKGTVEEFQGKFRFLSNFYPSKISLFGYEFASVEHGYQAFKWDFVKGIPEDFRDEMIKRFTTKSDISAVKAKRMGKKVPVDVYYWDGYKITVMSNLIAEKFKIPELRELLKATRHLFLQEGNNWGDTYWGVDLKTGKGQNNLGNLIMNERNYILLEESSFSSEEAKEICNKTIQYI